MWAVQQAGYDPLQGNGNYRYGGHQRGYGAAFGRGMFRDAKGDATLGTVGGANGRDADKGIAIGAVVRGVSRHARGTMGLARPNARATHAPEGRMRDA
jgi:hypothetical protein